MKLFLLLLFSCIFLTACKQAPSITPLFRLQEGTGISFSNDVQNTKDFNIFSYRNFYNGGGVAIG